MHLAHVNVLSFLAHPVFAYSSLEKDSGASAQAYAADHNGLRPPDTNLCDINSLR